MESFHVGDGTQDLLDHVLMVALDQKAYDRCQAIHVHCFKLMTEVDLSGEKLFMTKDYVKLVWKRIDLMRIVLKMGYNLVFSDADILWLRDPFSYLSIDAVDAAFSCDFFNGNETDLANTPNTGFLYFQSTNRTLELFNLWMRFREFHPSMHDQDVMGIMKSSKEFANLKIKVRFLNTNIISGFCSVSQEFENICTMHANCCTSIERKMHDLRLVLRRWKYLKSHKRARKKLKRIPWRVPKECVRSWT
ncbi:hypothetical protein O6H91_01G023900 [Diphasiastrum complanatum]|nr:hypothetical protein O6H91_01G023900 [Diphasiastrum complanatum]